MEFLVFQDTSKEEYARLEYAAPEELRAITSIIFRGESVIDLYPTEPPVWNLDPESGTKIGAYLPNSDNLKIVNTKFKEVLQQEAKANIEFHPLKVRDQKGVILDEIYWIANLLDHIECTDLENSSLRYSKIVETQVRRFYRLVLDYNKIPEGTMIFRLADQHETWLIEDKLIDLILDVHNLRGAEYELTKDYGYMFRGHDYVKHPVLGY